MSYDNVISNPNIYLSQALKFFGIESDPARVKEVISQMEIRGRSLKCGFIFYDPDFLRWVEQHAADEIREIGVPGLDEIESLSG